MSLNNCNNLYYKNVFLLEHWFPSCAPRSTQHIINNLRFIEFFLCSIFYDVHSSIVAEFDHKKGTGKNNLRLSILEGKK